MLAIGRALMSKPRLLLLDEPFLGLAPLIVQQIRAALEKLRASGLTMLIVEQKLDIALSFAQRAYVLIKGKIVLEQPTEELARRSDLKDLYFSRCWGYRFTRIRSTHGLKPARRSARNLRVVSSVSFPSVNLLGPAPMKTSGRGSTCAQSWPRMRRRSY